jgi:hypothetical protein
MLVFGLAVSDTRIINPIKGTWCFAERYFGDKAVASTKNGEGQCGERLSNADGCYCTPNLMVL